MKTNHPHEWAITLRGKSRSKKFNFTGTLDEALHEADVLESNVAFTVLKYIITRGLRVKKTTGVTLTPPPAA